MAKQIDDKAFEAAINRVAAKIKDGTSECGGLLPLYIKIQENKLHVLNHEQLSEAGLEPYIFRRIHKRNSYQCENYDEQTDSHHPNCEGWKNPEYQPVRKGWFIRGGASPIPTTRMREDGVIEFRKAGDNIFNQDFSDNPNDLVMVDYITMFRRVRIGWGRRPFLRKAFIGEDGDLFIHQNVVMHFGIAFGKKEESSARPLSMEYMQTPLVQFSVIASNSVPLLSKKGDVWVPIGLAFGK